MKIETTYYASDLESGECISCGEDSLEILKQDGRCIDCIEEEKLFERSMKECKNIDHENNRR